MPHDIVMKCETQIASIKSCAPLVVCGLPFLSNLSLSESVGCSQPRSADVDGRQRIPPKFGRYINLLPLTFTYVNGDLPRNTRTAADQLKASVITHYMQRMRLAAQRLIVLGAWGCGGKRGQRSAAEVKTGVRWRLSDLWTKVGGWEIGVVLTCSAQNTNYHC